ncbi:hypothetical protein Kpol_489p14 [Vanderwaltozyma polyspora DSM 70294]|uniref:PX domain-containing protein n=1 Tax=Vanderwaltozyma polyspora (strain ATCC 22028 / DSM 70294 / BCRC 21397 / CBS 2163 / NBRC 10782 / NRRL Y-8283 / UCD 57-17) TaxID=436907 RepID=A7TQ28_VANPO|nr:uncharacterized protein Kpol_489p14 [Vanderwaltozyma polyspora DSM 70294]EDO15633.1 hypothetical protein Kpol_489p14 [Vanderwaltozyma polyspora DSM 70294]
MNFDDDLSAPVWDELNTEDRKLHTELSGTFAKLSTNDEPSQFESTNLVDIQVTDANLDVNDEPKSDIQPVHTSESTRSIEVDAKVDDSSQEEENDQNKKEDNKRLMSILAPDNDLLNSSVSSLSKPAVKTAADPLFDGNVYSPLKFNEEDILTKANDVDDSKGTGKVQFAPKVLFNSARLRRRPVNDTNEKSMQMKPTDGTDPLSKFEKLNEFVDESIEDETQLNKRIAKSDILKEIEKPLFDLSQVKRPDITEVTGISNGKEALQSRPNDENDQMLDVNIEETKLVKYEIEVKDPIKVGDLTSLHVEYTVSTKIDDPNSTVSQVNRRYTDFRWLYRQLQSNHWGRIIPPPPEKQAVGRFKQDFMENRRFQMERMLIKISKDPILQRDQDFLMFLTSPSFMMDSKTREHYTGSQASNDSNDLSEIHISDIELLGAEDAADADKNGGIDGQKNRSFMSLSFSSPPKYEESDEFFLDQYQALEILEEQLKQLYKSLELIDSERSSLTFVTEEFANSIDILAKLEVTKTSADILTNFAETHRKIKEGLERVSSQESLTLGITLDEYIRSLASVRAIFNQRAKLGYYLVAVRENYSKADTQLNKLKSNSSSSNNIDKLNIASEQKEKLQKRYLIVKSKWEQIGEKIKREFINFETDKVKEFRNSIEIFLESSIEAQKECIELWETFYQNNM